MKKRYLIWGLSLFICTALNAHQKKVYFYLSPNQKNIIALQELTPIKFMPGLYVGDKIKNMVALSKNEAIPIPTSYEELEISSASILLKSIDDKQSFNNWWANGFTGKQAVVGILDSGISDNYVNADGQIFSKSSGLTNKNIIVNRSSNSGFNNYLNGVRTAHGTGVACIYANEQPERTGIAYGIETLLVTLAGDREIDNTDWVLTLHNLDWLLTTPNQVRPNIINYSFGNGDVYCQSSITTCNNYHDWSLVAQVVDYIVNHFQITWVKSAGNKGWIDFSSTAPYASTLSIPADSYNAIVVANMNNTIMKTVNTLVKTVDRQQHFIYPTSSRGPTLAGRRKPDIAAPGNDTRTCTPNEDIYAVANNPTFKPYTALMQYQTESETRLVGGTSIATPHVGAVAALIFDAGIKTPMAIKALLINSADTWTDNAVPGPGDVTHACKSDLPYCGHGEKKGSGWNRTYGWGYLNADSAYKQKNFVNTYAIKPKQSLCFQGVLAANDKVTLVWERRVGFNPDGTKWAFTPMSLALFNISGKLVSEDNSRIDNVLQVTPYPLEEQSVIVKVKLPKDIESIDGVEKEVFAMASSSQLLPATCNF